jgi:hypothetical protein
MHSETNHVKRSEENKLKIFITTKIKKHKSWTKEEDMLLLDIADRFKQKSWTKVSTFFADKNPAQCRARYKRIRPGIVKGAWAKEEDRQITEYVSANGKNWALISKMMPTRNGKQIRDRFLNYLDPNINRDKFTEDEDKHIIENYIKHGSKWSVIAKNFPGRTGDMIKNRFYSCLKRKIHIYEVNSNKRLRKKYYKSKKIKNSKAATNHIVTCNGAEIEGEKVLDNSKTPMISINISQNNTYSMENYPELKQPLNNNTLMEENIFGFTNALNNLIKEDQIAKLKATDLDRAYYAEILSKNIENLSVFNYIALSKILQLKSQIFDSEKMNKTPDFNLNTSNNLQDSMTFILNYFRKQNPSN